MPDLGASRAAAPSARAPNPTSRRRSAERLVLSFGAIGTSLFRSSCLSLKGVCQQSSRRPDHSTSRVWLRRSRAWQWPGARLMLRVLRRFELEGQLVDLAGELE